MQAITTVEARFISAASENLPAGYENWFTYEGDESASPDLRPWPNDPLGYGLPLSLWAAHNPLGYPVRLATNSPDVLLAAEESWSGSPQFFFEPPLNIRVAVPRSATGREDSASAASPRRPPPIVPGSARSSSTPS